MRAGIRFLYVSSHSTPDQIYFFLALKIHQFCIIAICKWTLMPDEKLFTISELLSYFFYHACLPLLRHILRVL